MISKDEIPSCLQSYKVPHVFYFCGKVIYNLLVIRLVLCQVGRKGRVEKIKGVERKKRRERIRLDINFSHLQSFTIPQISTFFFFPTNFLSLPFPLIPPKTILRLACILRSTFCLKFHSLSTFQQCQKHRIFTTFFLSYNLFSQQNIIVANIIFICSGDATRPEIS